MPILIYLHGFHKELITLPLTATGYPFSLLRGFTPFLERKPGNQDSPYIYMLTEGVSLVREEGGEGILRES